MKKIILLLTLVISLFSFSANKSSKNTKRNTTSTRTKSTKKDAMNMRRFSFLDLAKYPDPNRKPPTNYKKVREEYFKKHPELK
ncbi:hypothetical protein J5A73_08660 [Leptotrichia sp. oral taxon 218]|jgi:hypothetical protein|uniref:hypothetical protein n=1 Tax=Leptotrichia sp. oral taxon 218 TaxID=712361 RepID=UPI001B8B691A|nr:hypothetical protein [Leptotrichia sp. oral taxon 218]QUB95068.1 hypothetical protein J5A73_08660 [Leptotrichia sp. oral taxon 218]